MEKILLHSCCAPCSGAILEWMMANGYEPTVYYYNPNIFPEKEYLIRKNYSDSTISQVSQTMGW